MNRIGVVVLKRRTVDDEKIFQEFVQNHQCVRIVDHLEEAAKERELLRAPSNLWSGQSITPNISKAKGNWVYFEWRNMIVHILDEEDYAAVRLSRNQNIITPDEQAILASKRIVIAGLNVGNPAAICLVQEGVGKSFAFADNDALGLSNLNRYRSGITEIGVNKALLTAEQALEINPYLPIDCFEDGIRPENIDEFLAGADVLIEEMDNLPLKILIRERAKALHIPTVMVTGNGAGVLLDVERYDTDNDLKILSGFLDPEVIREIHSGIHTPERRLRLARDFMGTAFLQERLVSSFDGVGQTLIGIPQIAEATFLRGAVLSYAVRSLLLGHAVTSGRYGIQLEEILSRKL